MEMGSYIIKPLASISLADLQCPKASPLSTEHDHCDSGWETASIASCSPPSMMSEDSCDTNETMRCDCSGRSPSPFSYEPNKTIIRLSSHDLEVPTSSQAEYKSRDSAKLPCKKTEQTSTACNGTKQLERSLLVFKESKLSTSEWPKSRVLTIEQLNSERQPGPQQCSFCGKYEKPTKRHLRCELCGFATYCREKCQTRDRQRHYKHDCLIRQTTPWFSIKRNKYHLTEVCSAQA